MKRIAFLTTAIVGVLGAGFGWQRHLARGCDRYTVARGVSLVAHAGGGLPDRRYADNLAALDMAARHGFRLVELDFILDHGRILLGHDPRRLSETTFAQLLGWMRRHPEVSVITDAKTDNVPTLELIATLAGPLRSHFIPQIYRPSEYAAVIALKMGKPILTVYRIEDGWQPAANALDLWAVTVPVDRVTEARGVHHPVFLHTVDYPIPGYGLYTDCLIPG